MKTYGNIDITGKILGKILIPGQTVNLGLKYSSNTLTICQSDGSDLADTDGNRGYVCMQDETTAGKNKVLVVTANSTLTDGASSDTDGVSFGITLTADWANSMPMFIAAINDAGTCRFGVTRNPRLVVTPSTTYEKGNTSCNTQGDIMILHTSAVNDAQCYIIGGFTWTFSTTGDIWSIVTTKERFGIGQHIIESLCSTFFTYPLGQNGASASNTYQYNSNPNTCSATMKYVLSRNGRVYAIGDLLWAGAGGANAMAITTPLARAVADGYIGYCGYISGTVGKNFSALGGGTNGFTPYDITSINSVQSNALTGLTWYFVMDYRAF